jgi:hypothetical protein
MNQILNPQKLAGLCAVLTATWFMSGCGGLYSNSRHTTLRAPELHGRVLDAKTQQPIEGARVYFCDPPEHAVFTDTNGYFFMKAATNYHTGRNAAGGSMLSPKPDTVCVSKDGYRKRDFKRLYDGDPLNIRLQPNQ